MNLQERFRGCLLGLACGDAVGTTLEFKPRGTFTPITDMVGGGPFDLKRGEWTDDMSMALCMATSLIELQRFDANDMMQRFCRWWRDGYLSSNGECFDIGITTRDALSRFENTGDPYSGSTDPFAAGNGGIMRLAPVPMFFYQDRGVAIEMSVKSSSLTHAADECIDAACLFGAILHQALSGADKQAVLTEHGMDSIASESIYAIAQGEYLDKDERDIRSTGYVVDSLEAALWSFAITDSFESAILCAANLGGDADTVTAICGQVAGAYYGELGIPSSWLGWLVIADEIRDLADQLQINNCNFEA